MLRRELELLERETESALITSTIEGIEKGGGLLLVKGVAGTGKSRLLSEIRTAAVQAGFGVTTARSTEFEQDFAFGVVRQLFEELAFKADRTARESLWTGAARQAREAIETISSAGEPGDFAVLHGLYWLTINACQDRPLVLVVDDLQWCDRPSLRYLAYLLPRIETQPLLVAVALRTGEHATDERLLQHIISTPALAELNPKELSAQATASLLEQVMDGEVEEEFAITCHRAAGGNPLLLRELALTFSAQGLSASDSNAARVADLGGLAVADLVASRLMALPAACAPLARAVAVLGDRSPLMRAARLAGQDSLSRALECAILLEQRGIVRIDEVYGSPTLSFVHPLVRNAVYESLDRADRTTSHQRAAILLRESGSPAEQVAYHLMRIPATMDPVAVTDLRAAAAAAAARGAPESAYVYLRRSLDESPKGDERRAILLEAGKTALLFDVVTGARLLQEAWEGMDAVERAEIAPYLGMAYIYLARPDAGVDIQKSTISGLPTTDEDLKKRLQACLLSSSTWYVPGREDIIDCLPELHQLPHGHGYGDRLLYCAVAGRNTALGDPSGVLRARETLADDAFVDQADPNGPLACGWWSLAAADDDMSIASLDSAVKRAHVGGSLFTLASVYIHRGYTLLWHGDLAGAEQDGRETIRVGQLNGSAVTRLLGCTVLAEPLIEQGRLDEAERNLAEVGVTATTCPPGPVYLSLTALSRLQGVRGNYETALEIALQAEEACRLYQIQNPAVADWRTLAALALHYLDRDSEARVIADENLDRARRWGAPRTLGRALRVSGLISPERDRIELFEAAVGVLKDSPAHLEYAKALVDLGAALRKAGHRNDARAPLRQALDLATRCGAVPLSDRAGAELATAGARRRRTALTGPGALTPSERRVADLAAHGQTNRQIAQTLFVTPKTVEVHLSNCYRKLSVTSRVQLPAALGVS
ncbi:helix-turn-helix transcriptional regulator [Streptomyces sp. NPDC057616]|uniref:helix-turn-helix transcriptional regulator n=1 Tax=Streptomyces sp. NPDC057616 TaxID=3346183 RepID=UPI0036D1B1C4